MEKKDKVQPITELIYEEGRPSDGKDWSRYKRIVVKVPPTVNHREAAVMADKILKEQGIIE
ncbi:MAG: hypothetical protein UR39_C0002G0024 [Candidatus Woesebacteria bacterium GW2011_GWA1_33_30]|uniref:Uncharacterized protein n=1 Tax=Candidatus Woesebacteria bacterium GW2011_GWA2_33_28 TaxID=1618561 RepID=A0A0G0A9C9_9BACT|nr:MAG: hypothetical protein UR38_C0002G0024 [Candidatus Woesebacteria bacterium GW2011_GWA2_33_28]KKP48734.1 MAG: hypothetical protein UR39_C0002G0024 [Candidatus Woesebacteria bacterium GW2011_GWA1_33_30]KKP50007.1 MAG: hypothetical protein UR40_C0002G0024 [Microgenomates group bacterium GW2011_GWC1_33_32]KKP51778.1 MAG: hypothetical protein UR44_C0006G0024 [Candidatus Woesebacteria bacterium GW2011_GWB1_33_38]KKP58608.1 MAG: hypothetical protein UR48_C0003G0035 [Microgenomates group bacteriu